MQIMELLIINDFAVFFITYENSELLVPKEAKKGMNNKWEKIF